MKMGFRYKYVVDSEKPKYKAWLVAKGLKQEHGVDYDEIFSPVVALLRACMENEVGPPGSWTEK